LKFAVKELERNSKKCEKEEKMEKQKCKKAIQKGNVEGARIHAENAIRQKNQSLNYLRMSARVDAVASRVQSALTTRRVIDMVFDFYYNWTDTTESTVTLSLDDM
jgi:charged multivesicular body protein 1